MRKEVIGDCELYLGDCRKVLSLVPQSAAIISDVPYGIAHQGGGGAAVAGTRSPARRFRERIVGDDEPFDPAHLLEFDQQILWGADHFRARLPETGRFLAWDKLAHSTLADTFSDVEFAWHSWPGAARRFVYLWKGVQQAGEKGSQRYHPSQKPVALMSWCIKQAGLPAVVCDPYMGSGSTALAAAQHGCRFIGMEIHPGYFEVACKRLRNAYAQFDLFGRGHAPAPRAEQLDMLTDPAE
jgi:site-specific DNA-methyltransferase (adenine-specific)